MVDPDLVGSWIAQGSIIRIGTDDWQYLLTKDAYQISDDGSKLTFPNAKPIAVYNRLYGSARELIGVWTMTSQENQKEYIEERTYRQDGTYTFHWTERPRVVRPGRGFSESVRSAIALQREDGQTSKGAFGRAVRTIPDREFEIILAAGFASTRANEAGGDAADETQLEVLSVHRPLIQTTLTKPFRDQAFRRQVRLAYDNRCAISGLRFID